MAGDDELDGMVKPQPGAATGAWPGMHPGSSPRPGRPAGWGQSLGYPAWIEPWLPALHKRFNDVNRWVGVPLLRLGLGRYVSMPGTGYLMLLRVRGRKSGVIRDVPLGYCIVDDGVYCLAGFGRRAHWFQNILADPNVEVVLPSGAFTRLAEEVTDPEELRRVIGPLARSLGIAWMLTGLGNPWRSSADDLLRTTELMPVLRIRQTGIAAGPHDPGGWGWSVPVAASVVVLGWWWRRRRAPDSDSSRPT